jgi:hypothetical protein
VLCYFHTIDLFFFFLFFFSFSISISISIVQPVMHEFYDEIVFTNPATTFEARLMQYVPPLVKPISHLTVR